MSRHPVQTSERLAALVAEDATALTSALALAPVDPRGVHEARKAVRRLRSVLALARDRLGDEARTLDRDLRDLARGLSSLRDAHVVHATAAAIARDSDAPDDAILWGRIVQALSLRHDALLAIALEQDPGFVQRQTLAHRHADQLRALPWRRVHASDLRHGLRRSMRRQQRARQRALASDQPDDLHDWRRRLRRMRMQLHALKTLRVRAGADKSARGPGKMMARLVDQLGTLQDLELLHTALRQLDRDAAPPPRRSPRSRRTPASQPVQPLA